MTAVFPSEEWLKDLEVKLNSDAAYAEIAKTWEGDLIFIIEPDGNLKEQITFYLDLYQGACRKVQYKPDLASYPTPAFTLSSSYNTITDVLTGKLNPITAMMTMKLKVTGSMAYIMRNVPSVLDFVRCAQEVTKEIL